MKFSIAYSDPSELLADHETQYSHNGFLIRLSPPAQLKRDDPVLLSITLGVRELRLPASVLQIIPEVGVAVSLPDTAALGPLIEHARRLPPGEGTPASHRIAPAEPARGPPPRGPTRATKIRMARNGDRPDRDTILRDTDRSLQRFVLTNPGLSLAEVKQLAGLSTTLPQTLKAIAEKREWSSRPEIAMALLRNPRTPVPVALKMIPAVNQGELRVLVRSGHLRTPLLNAARKKISAH